MKYILEKRVDSQIDYPQYKLGEPWKDTVARNSNSTKALLEMSVDKVAKVSVRCDGNE